MSPLGFRTYNIASLVIVNNILLISDEFPPKGGGAGTIAMRLAKDLQLLGHAVTLISGDEGKESPENVMHIKVHRSTLIWPLAYRKVFREIELSNFDQIILNDFVSVYLAGLFFDIKNLKKSIVIIHGADSKFAFARVSAKHMVFLYKRFYARALRYCGCVVAVSQYAKEFFLQHVPGDLTINKINCAYAGIEIDDFDDGFSINKKDIGLPDDAKIMFTACRLTEDKGIFTQLELFKKISRNNSSLYWVVAGYGRDGERFKNAVSDAGLEGKIILVGKIPRKHIGAYYKLAELFWMLSAREGETMGLVYLEAALFGTPSIGYERYGVKEAILSGESGFFYNDASFENDVDYCLSHDMAESCKSFASTFKTIKFAEYLLSES